MGHQLLEIVVGQSQPQLIARSHGKAPRSLNLRECGVRTLVQQREKFSSVPAWPRERRREMLEAAGISAANQYTAPASPLGCDATRPTGNPDYLTAGRSQSAIRVVAFDESRCGRHRPLNGSNGSTVDKLFSHPPTDEDHSCAFASSLLQPNAYCGGSSAWQAVASKRSSCSRLFFNSIGQNAKGS